MTSISQTPGLQPQGQSNNGANTAVSQARTPASSEYFPQTVRGEAATSTIAGSAPSQPHQHGKSPSVSLNGKHMQQQATPVVGGLTIVNGNTAPNASAPNSSLHDRKTSVTINPSLIPNGGPAGALRRANSLRFGSMDSQGAQMNNQTSLPNQPQSTLGVNASVNPRATSPQTSPSPIPQPIASGGRPPSSLQGQGNNLNFGSFGGDPGDMNRSGMRPPPQGPMGPNAQSTHLRRESSHSQHGDMGHHGMPGVPPRGGYGGHGGRGRSYGQPHQPIGYNSPGPTYRSTPNQPRGGPNMGFHGHNQRSLGPFPHSPRQTARSPALSNVNPATPPMSQVPLANTQMQAQHYSGYPPHIGPQQVKQQSSYPPNSSNRRSYAYHKQNGPSFKHSNPPQQHLTPQSQINFTPPITLSPESGQFEQYLTIIKTQGFVAQGYDPNYYYQPPPYNMPQSQYQYMAPPSPRAAMNVPHPPQAPYMQPQYSNQGHAPPQATPLSRSPSQVSGPDRPGSSLGPTQTSVPMAQGPSHGASQSTSSPVPKSQFVVPPTKKTTVVIRDPTSGNVMHYDKQSASPARATPSPVKLGGTPASTPPPRTASRADHERTESKTMTGEEKKQSFQDAIAQKVRAEAEARKREEAEKAEKLRKEKEEAEAKAREESEAKKAAEETEKSAAQEKEKEVEQKESAAKETSKAEAPNPAEPAAPAEDEIDWDALERELAEKEAAAEKAYAEKKKKQQEEKARKEKEEQEAYLANLKKAELEAEAAEEARMKKLELGEEDGSRKDRTDLFASLKQKGAQSPTSAAESPVIRTPAESGAATPVSDISMGPPPPKPASGGKRDNKPAALKLETTKTVEPPQPSAAMKSLQTARFLEDPSKITYPPAIVSPNPALNANAPVDRKFKYNKEFLLQFQSVFKEKPSIDWDSRVRETVGDSTDSSSRPGSARTPIVSGGRTSSRPGIQGAFPNPMGKFGQAPGRAQTLPSGGMGRDGFPMAGTVHAPSMANPFGHFARGPSGMPISGLPMSRSSSSTMQQIPSPRTASHRGTRSGSKRDKVSKKEEETHNKAMPLTAGLDIKPLVPSQSGWKPRSVGQNLSGPALGGDGHMPPDVVQRKVKANLNKMTPEKFDRISDQILEIVGQSKDESDGRTLRQVIQLTFEKATDEAHWAPMYAKFCKRMLDSMSPEIKDQNIRDKQGNVVTGGSLFRKYLLNRCQEEFERGWKINLPEKPEGATEEAVMLSDEYYAAAAAKRRGLGLVKFIGELYKLGMLTERIMHQCVKKLVDYDGVPEEAEVESLTSLLRTIGYSLDNSEKGHGMMDAYFVRINMMMESPGLASRLKFMLMDIVDLRKAGWVSKDGDKGPKTIVEIREAAARAQQEQEMERMRQQANRGGRMPMSRGDSRNFSGGYGNQAPPPDFASSKVGSDDLRRLKTTRNTNQPVSFGPSSMFGARSNSGRRNLGPGGSLVRGSEDSGASSRTGTPPGGKDKKDDKEAASSINAFR
ncbi:hypothetical protein PAAG_06520 [Paracoccidioides lutzii Pb01]|uniref:MIF4G domain-containing protein n=1 Tax=Paracoccidioides lutzii (strain ATCC MYA-826 / Pb01) TaxID=502779 RepID=C1H6X9_PARBA|nr:hypothetical protein PAAG_06520 [Paracoccidioides lutzii Pb01]EEH35473.2 hypothetical protein PAAG_06520 [Paracoccidioides lutzii Pb01]